MKGAGSLLAKLRLQTFRVLYVPAYKDLFTHFIATDPSHPLYQTQRRKLAERPEKGLWWHVTTVSDLNKSGCVRSWARRRLRNAVEHELEERGYSDTGIFDHVNVNALKNRPALLAVLNRGKKLDLSGSLRLLVEPPLLSAPYAVVRAEVGMVFEAMLEGILMDAKVQAPMNSPKAIRSSYPLPSPQLGKQLRKPFVRPQRSTRKKYT